METDTDMDMNTDTDTGFEDETLEENWKAMSTPSEEIWIQWVRASAGILNMPINPPENPYLIEAVFRELEKRIPEQIYRAISALNHRPLQRSTRVLEEEHEQRMRAQHYGFVPSPKTPFFFPHNPESSRFVCVYDSALDGASAERVARELDAILIEGAEARIELCFSRTPSLLSIMAIDLVQSPGTGIGTKTETSPSIGTNSPAHDQRQPVHAYKDRSYAVWVSTQAWQGVVDAQNVLVPVETAVGQGICVEEKVPGPFLKMDTDTEMDTEMDMDTGINVLSPMDRDPSLAMHPTSLQKTDQVPGIVWIQFTGSSTSVEIYDTLETRAHDPRIIERPWERHPLWRPEFEPNPQRMTLVDKTRLLEIDERKSLTTQELETEITIRQTRHDVSLRIQRQDSQVFLSPGRYRMRVLVRDQAKGFGSSQAL